MIDPDFSLQGIRPCVLRGARLFDDRGEMRGELVLESGKIREIREPNLPLGPGEQLLELPSRAICPGFVNAHTHAAMTLFRGMGEGQALHDWLEKTIWPLEKHLTHDIVRAGSELAIYEMLSSGVTLMNDMYFFAEATAEAAQAMGMKAAISEVFFDRVTGESTKALCDRLERSIGKLKQYSAVVPCVGPHAPYTTTLGALKAVADLAPVWDFRLHFHLAETEREGLDFAQEVGAPLVPSLEKLGFLSDRLTIAHGIFLESSDAEILARHGVSVAHCPASNLKLASGKTLHAPRVFPFRELDERGVTIAIGSDGAASSNDLDILAATRMASLLQKHAQGDARALGPMRALRSASYDGYRALGLPGGRLEAGGPADFVVLDLDRPSFCPGNDLISDLIYATQSGAVEAVYVEGRKVFSREDRATFAGIRTRAIDARDELLARARRAE